MFTMVPQSLACKASPLKLPNMSWRYVYRTAFSLAAVLMLIASAEQIFDELRAKGKDREAKKEKACAEIKASGTLASTCRISCGCVVERACVVLCIA